MDQVEQKHKHYFFYHSQMEFDPNIRARNWYFLIRDEKTVIVVRKARVLIRNWVTNISWLFREKLTDYKNHFREHTDPRLSRRCFGKACIYTHPLHDFVHQWKSFHMICETPLMPGISYRLCRLQPCQSDPKYLFKGLWMLDRCYLWMNKKRILGLQLSLFMNSLTRAHHINQIEITWDFAEILIK